jgi:GNAT superfamily N-acetyltransferase
MSSVRPVDAFWAGFLGTSTEALATPGIQVVPHAGLAGYAGVWFFVHDQSCIVSAPQAWCDRLASALAAASIDAVLSPDGFGAVFEDAFDRTIGPSYLGSLEQGDFRPSPADPVRALAAGDADAVDALRAACPAEDWDAGDLKLDAPGAFAWVEDRALLAAASLTEWQPGVVGPGVLARPEARGRGAGRAVVSAAVEHALADGSLVIYQTLMQNTPAVGIARRLGFTHYASNLAVRLTRESP